MAKGTYVGVGGVARKVKKLYVGVNGVARKVKKGYIGINGVARLFYSSQSDPSYASTISAISGYTSQSVSNVPGKCIFYRGKYNTGSTADNDNGVAMASDRSLTVTSITFGARDRNYLPVATEIGGYGLVTQQNNETVTAINSSLTKTSLGQRGSRSKGSAAALDTIAFFGVGKFISLINSSLTLSNVTYTGFSVNSSVPCIPANGAYAFSGQYAINNNGTELTVSIIYPKYGAHGFGRAGDYGICYCGYNSDEDGTDFAYTAYAYSKSLTTVQMADMPFCYRYFSTYYSSRISNTTGDGLFVSAGAHDYCSHIIMVDPSLTRTTQYLPQDRRGVTIGNVDDAILIFDGGTNSDKPNYSSSAQSSFVYNL